MSLTPEQSVRWPPWFPFVFNMPLGPWLYGKEDGYYMEKNPMKIGDVIEVDNKDNRGRSAKSILLVGLRTC